MQIKNRGTWYTTNLIIWTCVLLSFSNLFVMFLFYYDKYLWILPLNLEVFWLYLRIIISIFTRPLSSRPTRGLIFILTWALNEQWTLQIAYTGRQGRRPWTREQRRGGPWPSFAFSTRFMANLFAASPWNRNQSLREVTLLWPSSYHNIDSFDMAEFCSLLKKLLHAHFLLWC